MAIARFRCQGAQVEPVVVASDLIECDDVRVNAKQDREGGLVLDRLEDIRITDRVDVPGCNAHGSLGTRNRCSSQYAR